MKHILFSVSQISEDYDKAGLQQAVNKAQLKIDQLGATDYDKVELSLTDGPVEIEFSAQTIAPDPQEPAAADGVE